MVQPAFWDIPPHEHRYVNIYFNPTEIKSYANQFVAVVEYIGEQITQSTAAFAAVDIVKAKNSANNSGNKTGLIIS